MKDENAFRFVLGGQSVVIPAFKDIDFGEIDANAEHLVALIRNDKPIFEKAFVSPPMQNLDRFKKQEKFLIYGQKGTGKSTILRHLEAEAASNGFMTDYIIFKDSVTEESDLFDSGILSFVPEQDILRVRHYLHVMKRMLLLKFLYLLIEAKGEAVASTIENSVPFLGKVIDWFRNSSLADVSSYAIRTAFDLAASINKNEADALKSVDFVRLLKSQNDTLLKAIISQAKKEEFKAVIYLDEIHFAFKDNASYRQDAMLVRDCIAAALNLNDAFIRNKVSCYIQLAVRSEFLEHPVIAQAEIQNQIGSFGEPVDWSSEKYDKASYLWKFILQRIKLKDNSVTSQMFFDNYVGRSRIVNLLEYTWSKPRDLIRYFNVVKRRFPNSISLNKGDFDTVIKEYSIDAWRELRTALSSFLNESELIHLEEYIGDNASRNYRNQPFTKEELLTLIASLKSNHGGIIDVNLTLNLFYILGLLQIRKTEGDKTIFNAYHRANLQPKWDWEIYFHPAVAKRFS